MYIYILREVDTARRIHAERGSSQFRRYSSTRYLTPPDRHVSRTRRSHPVTTLPRAAAAVDSHFRTPAHKSKTKSAAKTARRDGKRSTRTARSQLAWGAGREDMRPLFLGLGRRRVFSPPWRGAPRRPPQMCPRCAPDDTAITLRARAAASSCAASPGRPR